MEKKSVFSRVQMMMKHISGRLLYEFIFILILMVIMICIAFFATEYIVNYSAMEQSRQSAEVIFQQAEERVYIYVEDIENLFMNAVYNSSVTAFFAAENLPERWGTMDGFYQVGSNNKRISRYLENILLYNLSNELIGSQGSVFFPMQDEVQDSDKVVYTDRLIDVQSEKVFFEVGKPVFQKMTQGGYNRIGTAWLLFNVEYLQNIVDGTLVNDMSAVAILDGSDGILAVAGDWKEEYVNLWETEETRENLVYVTMLGDTGWRMVSVMPKESMLSGVTQIQGFSYLIYAMMLLIMGIIFMLLYFRIIKPISRQTAFVSNFTKDVNQRIQVTGDNEISELARKMNDMLDDIEMLNREIVNSQKRYLDLEYAKKQTEMIAYKSQINPHFLYNTFNCIRGMALYKGEKEIAELALSLSSLFRYCVQGDDLVTVEEALENLQHYANIVQYRFNGKHQVLAEMSDAVRQKKIPKLLIQPLVENAVFHGLETKQGNGSVWVKIEDKEAEIVITVEDNGDGIAEDKMVELKNAMSHYDKEETISERSLGIGFLNVYRRMRLFYGQSAVFEVESRKGEGTHIQMQLPANNVES